MIAPTKLTDGTTNPYGFGVANGSLRGQATIEHSGGIFGGNTDSLYVPSQDVFVAVFANSDRPVAVPAVALRRIAAIALGSPFPAFTRQSVTADAIAPMTGVYAIEGPDKTERRFYTRDGRYYVRRGSGPEREVFAVGENRFSLEPRALDWFHIVPQTAGGYAMEMHQRGEDAVERAVRSGPIPPDAAAVTLPRATLNQYVGAYALPIGRFVIAWGPGDTLTGQLGGEPALPLEAIGDTEFRAIGADARVRLDGTTATIVQGGREISGKRE